MTARIRHRPQSGPPERFLDFPSPAGGWGKSQLAYALVYPNRHAVGMANLGVQVLAHALSRLPNAVCHRAFADHPQTLEGGRGLAAYDVVALSLPFEGDYGEAVRLLLQSGIPLRSADRGADDPIVLAGGMAPTLNPEPLAPFLDAVFLGEADSGPEIADLHDFLLRHRHLARAALLQALAEARPAGIYVPAAYEVRHDTGRILARRPLGGAAETIDRRWASVPWDPARSHIWTPEDSFGGAYLLEISRGCPHACRFCAAAHATRPARFLPLETLAPLARFGAREVGRVGLVGAAVSDHPEFRDLAREILDSGADFTVSSFRAENLDAEVLELLARGGLKTLTVSLEAGTDRLRRRVGKAISAEDLLRGASLARSAGLQNLRVYAMVGLPGERDQDVEALADVVLAAREALGGGLLTLSTAPFVPKPHTPFQWEPMAPESVLRSRIRLLERRLGPHRGIKAVAEAPKWSRVQGLLSRGGRDVAPVLERAARTGDWREALRSPEAARVLDRERDEEESLPWDFIAGVPDKAHLRAEARASVRGSAPARCRPGACEICGVC